MNPFRKPDRPASRQVAINRVLDLQENVDSTTIARDRAVDQRDFAIHFAVQEEGASLREIAESLSVSPETIRRIVASVDARSGK